MSEFLQLCVAAPNVLATVLLLLACGYWVMVLIGAVGLELFDFDLDLDADLDADSSLESVLSSGAATLKFLNIGNVPIMLWISFFALSFWVISLVLNDPQQASLLKAGLQTFLNGALALIPTKLLTQPLRGRFDPIEPNTAEDLIGHVGEITTSEVSQTSGQARFSAEAAPLLLNVRTAQGVIGRNERVRIVQYDPANHIYIVARVDEKVKQEV